MQYQEHNEKPKVGVVLVNYNGYQDTIECVESLQKVTYPNLDIWVVDNASTNDSLIHLRQQANHENVSIVASPANDGFSAGNNIGIKAALEQGAEFVLVLNNDTIVEPDFIEPLLDTFSDHDDAGCVISKILYQSEPNKLWYGGGTFNPWFCRADHIGFNETDTANKSVQEVAFASGCCMMLTKQAIEESGLMDEDYFLYVEDTEYSLRLAKAGFKLFYNPNSAIYHKVSATTQSGSDLSQYYTIRNTLYLGKTYLSRMQRFSAMLYKWVFYTHKVVTKQYRIKNIFAAELDYMMGNMGRSSRF